MQRSTTGHSRRDHGFTLVELMIVVVIVSILVAVAVPLYTSQVRQSRRTDARTALLDLAGREERYLATNPSGYSSTASYLGYTALPTTVGSGYYTLNTPCIAGVGATVGCGYPGGTLNGPAFYITAVPVAGSSQANDSQCQVFGIDSTGRQFAQNGSGTDTTSYCWSN
jgi:type IV pilus assembly protein PilE